MASPEADSEQVPDLVDARAYSGRRLIELIIGVALVIGVAVHYRALATLAVVVAIVAMIMIHELGHYLSAKASGMKVTEFFLGFGPRVWSFQRGETEYGIKALPLGGYVRIIGMTNVDEVAPEDESRTYRQGSFPRRFAVSIAGSFMHFVMAFGILWYIFSGIGGPIGHQTQIAAVPRVAGIVTPAVRAGLKVGAVITAANGVRNPSLLQFERLISTSVNRPVHLTVSEAGAITHLTVVPVSSAVLALHDPTYRSKHPYGVIGVSIAPTVMTYSLLGGSLHAVGQLGAYMGTSLGAILSHFSFHGIQNYVSEVVHPSSNVHSQRYQSRFESPVGIVALASDAAHAGLLAVLSLLFGINVFVGVFNLFPLLPLDGGHVVIAIYERLRSRKGRPYHADIMKLLPLTYAVLSIIILLGVTALYLDITHPIANPFL
ncbi:MAG: M50 family metallopeptidase [Ferrimicrobium sp.]